MNYPKISFCTVCMNRLHHIKQTLIDNIENNNSYPNLEYILLDYGSSDGLVEWVNTTLKSYIEKGILKFYRTPEPIFFDRSHSRNLMFKLASGDIICNIDADNYAGKGFADYVCSVFSKEDDIYLVADTQKRFYFLRNAFGRFCVKKTDFLQLGGLDERMKSYGSETLDFYERLQLVGKKEHIIEYTKFLKTISHGDEERISNEYFVKSLEKLYIHYISSEESELLILYKNGTFEKCTIIPERVETHLPATLKNGTLEKGTWKLMDNILTLNYANKEDKFSSDINILACSKNPSTFFYLIEDKNFLLQIAKNYSFISNTAQLNKNKSNKDFFANEGNYGKGIVTKNFSEELIIK